MRDWLFYGSSSVGRALVSKTRCREFEPLLPCEKSIDSMKKIINYIKESYNELVYKVSWPTRTELSNSAVVVMFASLIIAALIFVIDLGFEGVMRFFYEKIF